MTWESIATLVNRLRQPMRHTYSFDTAVDILSDINKQRWEASEMILELWKTIENSTKESVEIKSE